IADAMMAQGIA
nr:NAD(+)-dependent glutamate dehydrogenase, GDH [Clostridium symbiosum, Peptide Partial, 11 aa] [[Clostridium] symbiosum]